MPVVLLKPKAVDFQNIKVFFHMFTSIPTVRAGSIARLLILLVVVALAPACKQPAADAGDVAFIAGEKHLLVMHPTVNNIKTIYNLIEKGLFTLPAGYRIVGVYAKSGAYDYALSEAYISENSLTNFALYGIEHDLEPDILYGDNALTETFRWLFNNSEGAIFLGGPDLPPATYGHPANLLTIITDPNRQYLELSFLYHLLGGSQDLNAIPLLEEDPFYCILGICLGMQSMNVATGGTLFQDIPTEIYQQTTAEAVTGADPNLQHRNYYPHLDVFEELSPYWFHQIIMEENSMLAGIAGNSSFPPFVLSSHHQAVRDLGKGFRITAWSVDRKTAEAIEHSDYPNVLGIQFHPEGDVLYQPESKLRFVPGDSLGYAFLERYPGEKGETFHRNLWKHVGLMYP